MPPSGPSTVLKAEMEPWRVSLFGDRFHVIVDGDAQAAARRLAARLAREGIRVLEATEQDYSLEDVFLAIAARGERGARAPAARLRARRRHAPHPRPGPQGADPAPSATGSRWRWRWSCRSASSRCSAPRSRSR